MPSSNDPMSTTSQDGRSVNEQEAKAEVLRASAGLLRTTASMQRDATFAGISCLAMIFGPPLVLIVAIAIFLIASKLKIIH